jgi:hypothetical protein
MSVSPSPERIEICTPPESPNVAFNDQDPSSGPEITFPTSSSIIITPSKAIREVKFRRRSKRRRLDSVDVAINISDNDDESEDLSDVFGGYSHGPLDALGSGESVVPIDVEGAQLQVTADLESGGITDTFEHYADAALAGCSGFFQISEMLFVVQGWDVKWQRSTVSEGNVGGVSRSNG